MARGSRSAFIAAAVVVSVGIGVAVWTSQRGERQTDRDAPPTLVIAGERFRLNGAAGISELRLDGRDPKVLHVETMDVVSGIPSRCQRRTVVRVVDETDTQVVLQASEYRRTDRGPEAQCPAPQAAPTLQTIKLRQPLADRDVHEPPGAPPVHVQGRSLPGRTVVRGTPSCAATSATRPNSGDFANFIRHGGRSYVNRGLAQTPGAVFGGQVGVVRCRLSESLTPTFKYRPTDGDAGYLDKGTPYYAIQGRSEQQAIGASFNGQRLVFTYDPSLR